MLKRPTLDGNRQAAAGSRRGMPAHVLAMVVVAAYMASSCSSPNQVSGKTDQSASSVSSAAPSVFGKAPPGAIVTLEPAAPRTTTMPDAPAVMDQYGKQFVPGELFVRVGQPVEFRNTEDQAHNVIVKRSGSGANVFHVSTDPSEKYVHTFDRAGRYDVSCDLHLGMAATIIATTSPYVAIADANGDFTIANVEAGPYKLTALVSGENFEKAIEVRAGRNEVSVGR